MSVGQTISPRDYSEEVSSIAEEGPAQGEALCKIAQLYPRGNGWAYCSRTGKDVKPGTGNCCSEKCGKSYEALEKGEKLREFAPSSRMSKPDSSAPAEILSQSEVAEETQVQRRTGRVKTLRGKSSTDATEQGSDSDLLKKVLQPLSDRAKEEQQGAVPTESGDDGRTAIGATWSAMTAKVRSTGAGRPLGSVRHEGLTAPQVKSNGEEEPQPLNVGASPPTEQGEKAKLPTNGRGHVCWKASLDQSLLKRGWPVPLLDTTMSWEQYLCFMHVNEARTLTDAEFARHFELTWAAVIHARRRAEKAGANLSLPTTAMLASAVPAPGPQLDQVLALAAQDQTPLSVLKNADPEVLMAKVSHKLLACYVAGDPERLSGFIEFIAEAAERVLDGNGNSS